MARLRRVVVGAGPGRGRRAGACVRRLEATLHDAYVAHIVEYSDERVFPS